MAELRIHDQSSIYFKSIRTGDTPKDINVKIPDKSGWLITDTTLQEILNSGANIASSQILKPDITETPLVHPEAYADMLPIASYRTNDTFVGEHQATEWVASLVPDFSTIIDSTADPLFRDGWYPAVNEANRKVYVKYRFISEDICSPFSDALEFTTPEGGVAIPTLSVVEDGSTPLIKGSEFRLFGNLTGVTHIGSSWEIIKVSDGTKVKTISNSPDYLREYKVEDGILQPETEYKITLVYHTSHTVFSRTRKVIGTYKTPASTIGRPTLTFTTSEGRYEINGSPFVVNSGTDRHKFTTWVVKNGTGSVVYREENSKELTRLNLTGILEPDNDYRVSAVYIGDKSKSNEGVINFRTPAEDQSNLNKLITITKEAHGGVKLVMEKFKMPVAEKLLYLTWTIQNYNDNNPIALEVRMDSNLDNKYDQDLVYDMQPAESWLKWMPNNEIVNPVISLSAKGRVVGEKTVLNYATQVPTECRFDYVLGEMSIEDNDSLSPLIKITDATGADSSWISKRGVIWELYTRDSSVPVMKATGTDYDQHRFTNIDYATNYTVKCTYKTNFGNWTKTFDFRSRPFTLPAPIVNVDPVGIGARIRATGENLNIANHPEKSHGSTTWTLYSNTGTVLWQSIKNTANLLSIDIPRNKLERATDYKVGVIFHSVDDTISSVESVVNYSHIGIIYTVKEADFVSGTHDNVMLSNQSVFLVKKVFKDLGGAEAEETTPNAYALKVTIKDGTTVVWSSEIDGRKPAYTGGLVYPDIESLAGTGQIPKSITLDPKKTYSVTLDVYVNTGTDKILSSSITKNFTVLNTAKMDEFNFLVPADKLAGYGTSSVGGIFARGYGYFGDSTIHNSSVEIDKRGTWCALRDYTGEWGNNTNCKKNNGDATNPANHFDWISGQRVSKKGKLYEANIDQAWNQFDPETDTNAWQEITKDIRLPQDAELLDCLGLNWGVGEGTNAFSYSDRKWSDGTTIRDLPDPFGYYKMISPTTKKMCFITISFNPNTNPGIGIANMCWNDLVARQPELVEVDRFTMRFGTQLYYVRIPTKEEVTLLCVYQNKLRGNAIAPRNVAFCQTPGPGVETVKALSSAGENAPTETDVNVKSRILEICFVLTPIPEGEEPYQTAMLNKLYPNMTLPQGNLSWSTENLTEGPDTNYFQAGLKLAYDRFTDTGYFGRVPVGTFKSYKKLMDTYGVSGRTQHYDGTGTNDRDVKFYDMFYYHGLVVYIPNGAPWSNMSFDYCKSQGILFGTNMGSYHSYVGDAKLEDSKDNWYRISGMNISRWNLTTWGNTSRSLWDYRADGGFVLAKAGIGLASKSHWSDLLYKALKQDDALTVTRGESTPTGVVDGFVRFAWTGGANNMDSLDIVGNSFDFKNRLTKVDGAADTLALNCTTSQGGLYGKASTIFYNMYNIESTLHANNYYFRDTPIEPNRNSCCFRPMLTLKPVGAQIDMIFKLVLRVTRTLRDPQYTLGTAIEIIDGPRNLIKETKFDVYLDKDGKIKQPPAPAADYNTLKATIVTPSAGELYASSAPLGAQLAHGAINVRFALINGKYLYLKNPEILAGLENIPWDANGGVNSGTITLTNLDTYSI